jgi:hypothetical protein
MKAHYKFFAAAAPLLALTLGSATLAARDPSLPVLPEYNAAAVVHFRAQVVEFRVVPAPGPFEGAHLFVKGSGSETIDVFLGPAKYIKIFNLPLAPGDRVDVLGSEMNFKGGRLILGREVTKGAVTMILRDESGTPMWLDWMED